MASGRPVVAGAATDSEVAKALSGCGVVVPPESGPAFAEALRGLADASDRRRTLGQDARRRALALWNRQDVLTDFETRLRSLTGGSREAAAAARSGSDAEPAS